MDSEEGLSESFGIQGLPTIALIKNGKQYVEYEGQRTVDALLEYLKQPLPSSWKEAGEAPPPQQQEQEEFKWDTLDDPSTVLTQHNWADVTKDKVRFIIPSFLPFLRSFLHSFPSFVPSFIPFLPSFLPSFPSFPSFPFPSFPSSLPSLIPFVRW